MCINNKTVTPVEIEKIRGLAAEIQHETLKSMLEGIATLIEDGKCIAGLALHPDQEQVEALIEQGQIAPEANPFAPPQQSLEPGIYPPNFGKPDMPGNYL